MESKGRRALGVVVGLILVAGIAAAQDTAAPPPEDEPRWEIFVGGFFPDVDSKMRVYDPEIGLTPPIDFEELGVKSNVTALRLGASVRLSSNGRHELQFEYLKIDRDGRFTIEEDLEFGGEVFPVGVEVDGAVNTEDFDIHYTYNIIKNDRGTLGLSAGLHALRFEATARAVATIEGLGQQIEIGQTERVGDDFPLPVVGIRFSYELLQYVMLTGGFKWFGAEVEDVDGSFTDAWLRVEYQVAKPIALGIGLAQIDVSYDRPIDEAERDIISASYKYSGAEAFVRFRF